MGFSSLAVVGNSLSLRLHGRRLARRAGAGIKGA